MNLTLLIYLCAARKAAETELQTHKAAKGCVVLWHLSRDNLRFEIRRDKISGMNRRKNKRIIIGVLCMMPIALLPVAASKLFSNPSGIEMSSYDNKKMEQDILREIPPGSKSQFAKQVMAQNGFTFSKQTPTMLGFENEISTFGWGTYWWVEINLEDGITSTPKVSIEPAD